MFCYHCQEAKKNKVCDTAGICGKKANVSSLQDLLMFSLKGLAYYCHQADEYGLVSDKTNRFMAKALFSMVTNVNFSPADFVSLVDEAIRRRNYVREQFLSTYQQKHEQDFSIPEYDELLWQYDQAEEKAFTEKGDQVGVEKDLDELDADVHALQECLLYAVKGLGSMAVHNLTLGIEDQDLYHFMHEALSITLSRDNTLEQIQIKAERAGELGQAAMKALGRANSKAFGEAEPSTVYLDSWENPGILVSGHDLQDIQELLEQTAGSGIDVYTHGEAIAAHSHPAFKKYFNLVANYGGAWQDQKTQFPKFKGPILVTTNSIQQPKKTYQDKLFSTGMVGWPGVPHIADRKPGQAKDFSEIIALAKQSEAPTPLTEGQCLTGYGEKALSQLTEKVAEAIKSEKIKRLIVVAGTDGRHKERRYYSELAENLPQDAVLISAGDVKFRFYQQDFGNIDGIPRLIDVGQSNDFYLIIDFLSQLQTQLGADDLNALPVSFNIAWYEQKTILMMLALFALGVKNLRVGPTLPPFFSEKILQMLDEKYVLKGIDTVETDIASMLAGN